MRGMNLPVLSRLESADGRFRFTMQGDGNLVLYGPGKAAWATHTHGKKIRFDGFTTNFKSTDDGKEKIEKIF